MNNLRESQVFARIVFDEDQVRVAPATTAFSAFRRKRQVTRIPLHICLLASSLEFLSQILQRAREIIFPRKCERILFRMLTFEVLTSLIFDSHTITREESKCYKIIRFANIYRKLLESSFIFHDPIFACVMYGYFFPLCKDFLLLF